MKKITKLQFYLLSFTWGLPMSIIGALVCCALMVAGFKLKKYGHCYYIEIGKNWGGVNFGWLFLVNKNASNFSKKHELGHGYQNACIYGWIFPIFGIISVCRYWLDRFGVKINYYKWHFEKQASLIGMAVMEK